MFQQLLNDSVGRRQGLYRGWCASGFSWTSTGTTQRDKLQQCGKQLETVQADLLPLAHMWHERQRFYQATTSMIICSERVHIPLSLPEVKQASCTLTGTCTHGCEHDKYVTMLYIYNMVRGRWSCAL